MTLTDWVPSRVRGAVLAFTWLDTSAYSNSLSLFFVVQLCCGLSSNSWAAAEHYYYTLVCLCVCVYNIIGKKKKKSPRRKHLSGYVGPATLCVFLCWRSFYRRRTRFVFHLFLPPFKKKEAAAFALTTDLHRIPACVCITSRAYIFAPLWWTLARNSNKCSREKL